MATRTARPRPKRAPSPTPPAGDRYADAFPELHQGPPRRSARHPRADARDRARPAASRRSGSTTPPGRRATTSAAGPSAAAPAMDPGARSRGHRPPHRRDPTLVPDGLRRPVLRGTGGDHPAPVRPPGRDHRGDGVRRAARGAAGRAGPERGRARARDHPGQHQPPRARADDHRPRLPREDQRQHRQLGRALVHRGRGREAALGHALGRRHGHGPVDRRGHPRDPRVDRPELGGADRHGADLPGAGEGRAASPRT